MYQSQMSQHVLTMTAHDKGDTLYLTCAILTAEPIFVDRAKQKTSVVSVLMRHCAWSKWLLYQAQSSAMYSVGAREQRRRHGKMPKLL